MLFLFHTGRNRSFVWVTKLSEVYELDDWWGLNLAVWLWIPHSEHQMGLRMWNLTIHIPQRRNPKWH